MPFEPGNNWWEARSRHGRKLLWENREELLEACFDYFEWVEANPLKEGKVFQYEGKPVHTEVKKMRAMTKSGLCVFLGCSRSTWEDYGKKDDFSDIVELVNECIRDQKFSGAAAGLLNANLVARELGITEKSEVEVAAGKGQPLPIKWLVEFVNPEEKPSGHGDAESQPTPRETTDSP